MKAASDLMTVTHLGSSVTCFDKQVWPSPCLTTRRFHGSGGASSSPGVRAWAPSQPAHLDRPDLDRKRRIATTADGQDRWPRRRREGRKRLIGRTARGRQGTEQRNGARSSRAHDAPRAARSSLAASLAVVRSVSITMSVTGTAASTSLPWPRNANQGTEGPAIDRGSGRPGPDGGPPRTRPAGSRRRDRSSVEGAAIEAARSLGRLNEPSAMTTATPSSRKRIRDRCGFLARERPCESSDADPSAVSGRGRGRGR